MVGLALALVVASGCDTVYEHAKVADGELKEFFGTTEKPPTDNTATEGASNPTGGQESDEGAKGIEEPLKLAALRQSAENEDPKAAYELGQAYAEGTGVQQDPATAVFYFDQAADLGYAPAQFELAEAYANGWGVKEDIAWAMRWYGRAAYQGYADAQFAYGVLIATGRGLPENPRVAYRWLRLADQQNHPDAPAPLEAIEKRLSPKELALEEDWIKLFKPAKGPDLSDPPTVLYVQYQLGQFGYNPGPVDGQLGSRTAAAIETYNSDHGLSGRSGISEALLESILEKSSGQSG